MRKRRSLAGLVLYASLPLIFLFLLAVRPPAPFYVLPLASIALAAMLYEFAGGTLAAVAALVGVAVLIALDPDAPRRARVLQEVWPILSMYIVVGPVVGGLAMRERDRERRLVSAAEGLHAAQEIAQAINTSLDLEQTLQAIIAETRRLAPFDRAAVLLRDGDLLRVVAASDGKTRLAELEGQVFTMADSAAGRAMQSRRVWIGGPQDLSRYPDTRALCPPAGTCWAIPLESQGRATGVFALGGSQLTKLEGAGPDNLMQIASQMAVAIEHARLFEAERQWSKRMAAIGDACHEIAASLNLERTLRLVMAKGVETLPMDAGALFQFDATSQTYQVAVSHNLSPDHVARITFGFEEGVPGWVVKHRRSLIIPDAAADARVHPHVVNDNVKSVLAAPLVAREQVVGVFNLYCKTGANAFDDQALRLAEVFAAQAAIAIENARLVEELRRAATELEARVERRTRQLQQTQAQIIQAEKMAVVGRLAASVAHEVNNPLQAIALQLKLISGDGPADPFAGRLEIVQEELTRIAGIVQQLLEFQRPTPGRRAPHAVPALLNDVLALARKQLQQRGVTVVKQGELTFEPVLVAGDQIKQVFLNLILNAVDAMPGGGELRIAARRSNGAVTITFTDTGVGMSDDVLRHLFEPFYSTKTRGTGLGLAVSREIVTQHGGTLTAGSRPGGGATFTICLPVGRNAPAED